MTDQIRYKDPVNEVLQKLQGEIRTQDLNQIEVHILEEKFGEDWFEKLGYDKLKPHKKPQFNFYA